MATGTTAIRSPTDDLSNHTIVLRQLKEVAEVGQRLRGDPTESFVKISELVNAGVIRFINNTVQGPNGNATAGGGTVTTADSVQGTGASGSPIQLVGDSAAPGNSMAYSTNGSGTKGWYAAATGSTTLAGLSDVSISSPSSGQVLTYNSATSKWNNATSGSTVALPGTIPNLCYWFESDTVLVNSGFSVNSLYNRTPWVGSGHAFAAVAGAGPLGTSTQLNSLPVVNFNNSPNCRLLLQLAPTLNFSTVFVLFKITALAAMDFICGNTNSLQVRVNSTNNLEVVDSGIAVIGAATATFAAGTWYQGNVTYDNTTGNYAFRVSKAASGSGTSIRSISAPSIGIGYSPAANTEDFNGMIAALIVYNRVLTPTEITNVENYLTTKWGV